MLTLALAVAASSADAGTDRQVRQVFSNFSECAAARHPKDAVEVVLSTMPTKDIFRLHPNLITADCLDSGELRIPGADFVRYGLAEALIRREFSRGLPADIRQAAPLAHFEVNDADYRPKPGKRLKPKALALLEENRNKAIALRTLSIYGECVARADPAAALRLVLTNAGSSKETEAFAAMQPVLSSCLPKGQKVALDRAPLRGTLAMNLYRLAKAPRIAAL